MSQPKEKKKKKKLPITIPINKSLSEDKLPLATLKNDEYMIFSYKYFNCTSLKSSEFNNCFKNQDDYAKWITFCLNRISNLSTMKIPEISNAGTSTRFHPVDGGALTKLKQILIQIGLDVDKIFKQEGSENFYELSFGTGNGRMFGYLIDNRYYVLLMDPNHLVYKCVEKGGNHDLLYKNYDPWKILLTRADLSR